MTLSPSVPLHCLGPRPIIGESCCPTGDTPATPGFQDSSVLGRGMVCQLILSVARFPLQPHSWPTSRKALSAQCAVLPHPSAWVRPQLRPQGRLLGGFWPSGKHRRGRNQMSWKDLLRAQSKEPSSTISEPARSTAQGSSGQGHPVLHSRQGPPWTRQPQRLQLLPA